ncbi:FMN-binding protein [Sphaerochaeta sp. S2]|uniref:FMN-binding protein n=1 Tax=Sphaerochaeta sp. S2 TaxID=2798868 RepID=UPI0018E98F93|nr:FMN-binding protein [Sphaerochaeta sp. S2]MBJ2357557.1 FMN-binding protein [Sphaerochaeta sp. S2]MCK9348727.1 FMN-binding protein [Sphaerochaeta sp.]MDY0244555.1 FMN-binding protein [Sphaerochaeta sp.]
MTKNLKYSLILLSICAVSAFALAMTNSITAPVIEQYEYEQRQLALTAVSNGFAIGSEKPVEADPYVTYTIDLTDNGQLAGYIVGLKSAGYGGQMTLVASYKVSGEMMVAQLLTHSETPGLGSKAADSSYMDKFQGTGADTPVPTDKTMLTDADAQAISGASITFGAVSRAIEAGSAYVKNIGGVK